MGCAVWSSVPSSALRAPSPRRRGEGQQISTLPHVAPFPAGGKKATNLDSPHVAPFPAGGKKATNLDSPHVAPLPACGERVAEGRVRGVPPQCSAAALGGVPSRYAAEGGAATY